jgi:sec-independent protein translocase protein TatA
MLPIPNIGPGELILILIIALVVLGPGKLPDVASSLGKSVREFRKAASDVTDAARLDTPAPTAATASTPTPAAGTATAPVEPASPAPAAQPDAAPAAPAPVPGASADAAGDSKQS